MVSFQMTIWKNTKHEQVKSVKKEREEKEQVYCENCLKITKQTYMINTLILFLTDLLKRN